MKCPKCNVEIEEVFVVSEYYQQGILEGNEVVDYDTVDEPVGRTLRYECRECQEDISEFVKEV